MDIKAVAILRPPSTYKSKAEERYAFQLEMRKRAGEIVDWRYEPMALNIGADTRYVPDFLVVRNDGTIEFQEVKGFMRDQARVKIRVAASMLRWFDFSIVWSRKGGFERELVTP